MLDLRPRHGGGLRVTIVLPRTAGAALASVAAR
jgi:hypothetical protein